MNHFYRILPAFVTLFDTDGNFAAEAFERLLARIYGAGVYGIYVCWQTGEGLLQPLAPSKDVSMS